VRHIEIAGCSSSRWDQMPIGSFSRLDHACAWSWDLEIPPNNLGCVGVLIKSGPYVSDVPSFALAVPAMAMETEPLMIMATVSDTRWGPIDIRCVIECDLSGIQSIWQGPAGGFDGAVSSSLSPGGHEFRFSAASARRVSRGRTCVIKVADLIIIAFAWSCPRGVAGYTEANACAWSVCQLSLSDPSLLAV
jgi:hypothetical protein